MESHQQGQTVLIEMERLNKEPSVEPVPSPSNTCLKRGIILVSVVGLLVIISTCLLFLFVFRQDCVQMDMPPSSTAGKVKIHCSLQETKKGHYEIFQAQKAGKYLILGWVRWSTNDNRSMELVHIDNSESRTLQNKSSKSPLFFHIDVFLLKNNSIHLQSTSLPKDFCFFVDEP